ncbi:unnamed protein product [Acanthosepion pharaonis]|uniref:Uncharacterized protein n=1 Tax=Acanthosepion pharaonis TaxID=158019 RepID=A0A812AZV1_ACAPH|nr:unnamed protein product [Sepia pharaonis]
MPFFFFLYIENLGAPDFPIFSFSQQCLLFYNQISSVLTNAPFLERTDLFLYPFRLLFVFRSLFILPFTLTFCSYLPPFFLSLSFSLSLSLFLSLHLSVLDFCCLLSHSPTDVSLSYSLFTLFHIHPPLSFFISLRSCTYAPLLLAYSVCNNTLTPVPRGHHFDFFP